MYKEFENQVQSAKYQNPKFSGKEREDGRLKHSKVRHYFHQTGNKQLHHR